MSIDWRLTGNERREEEEWLRVARAGGAVGDGLDREAGATVLPAAHGPGVVLKRKGTKSQGRVHLHIQAYPYITPVRNQ